jgi:hypothetical protein
MTEQQYIDATNLAKIRVMMTVLWDTLPMRPDEESMHTTVRRALRAWIDYLEDIVRCNTE